MKKDDHGPDALLCAALPFPFVDEFDTAISQLLSNNDRERLKVTDKLLDACIRDYSLEPPNDRRCSMGVSVGSSCFYVVILLLPDAAKTRQALFIGKAKSFDDLDALMEKWNVRMCLISTQPEPHLVQAWRKQSHRSNVRLVDLLNDGTSKPDWPKRQGRVTVDRTFLLNSAYEEIREQGWLIPYDAHLIDNGEFYAQLKAPSRVRDLASGELKHRWTEAGALDHYRFAHAFDHLYAAFRRPVGLLRDLRMMFNGLYCCMGPSILIISFLSPLLAQ